MMRCAVGLRTIRPDLENGCPSRHKSREENERLFFPFIQLRLGALYSIANHFSSVMKRANNAWAKPKLLFTRALLLADLVYGFRAVFKITKSL